MVREPLSARARSVLAVLSADEGHSLADIVARTSGLTLEDAQAAIKELATHRLVRYDREREYFLLTMRGVNKTPEVQRMAIHRDEREAITVALMIAIDNASRFGPDVKDQSPTGIKIREDYPRRWRELLERFSG